MKIASSDIQMTSNSVYSEQNVKSENLETWTGKRQARISKANAGWRSGAVADGLRRGLSEDRVTLSHHGKASKTHHRMRADAAKDCSGCQQSDASEGVDDQLSMMKLLVEKMTGRKITIFNSESLDSGNVASAVDAPVASDGGQEVQSDQGWGISYDYQESYTEVQAASFSAEGTIQTADGQNIKFSLSLEMRREYHQESSLSFRAGDAVQKDPLVVNFNGASAELTSTKFSFDLDLDGTQDDISFVQSGSGFLVLDKNQDGIVNDGSELFGPGTGDGFSELAAYDSDHNNWIDKNDSVFDQLSVWTKNQTGEDQLNSLQSKSIGAIYLSSVSTLFDLKDSDNTLKGQIAATGIYAEESGSIKTIQHLNIAV
jgi:hypothetical protein